VHASPGGQSELLPQPAWQRAVESLHWCPAGHGLTRQFGGFGTHVCVAASQRRAVPQAPSLLQPVRQTPVETSQYVRAAGQPATTQFAESVHCPSTQKSCAGHARPQAPQFAGSLSASGHCPPSGPPSPPPPSGFPASGGGAQILSMHTSPAAQLESLVQPVAGKPATVQPDSALSASAAIRIMSRISVMARRRAFVGARLVRASPGLASTRSGRLHKGRRTSKPAAPGQAPSADRPMPAQATISTPAHPAVHGSGGMARKIHASGWCSFRACAPRTASRAKALGTSAFGTGVCSSGVRWHSSGARLESQWSEVADRSG
jgi:hypothetical protein